MMLKTRDAESTAAFRVQSSYECQSHQRAVAWHLVSIVFIPFFVDIITFIKTVSAQHMCVFLLTASHFYDLTNFFETFPFTLTCRISLPDGIPCLVVFKDRLRTLLFRRNTVAMRKKHIADAVTFWTAFCKLRFNNLFKQQAHLAQSLYRG